MRWSLKEAGGKTPIRGTKGFVRNPEGFSEVSRGRSSPARAGRRAEHVAGGEARRFGVVEMQKYSLGKEDLPSASKGEAQRGEGKVHQATPALERTEPIIADLMEQVRFLGRLNQYLALVRLYEPPGTDPYARWCGRAKIVRPSPIPISVWELLIMMLSMECKA